MLMPSGPINARLMIVADCVSYRDIQTKTILGDREFDRMLVDAGIPRGQCFVTALIRGEIQGQNFDLQVAPSLKARTPNHQPLHNKYIRKEVFPYVEALEREIDLVKPKVILVLGNGPLFCLTEKWGIKSWRSSILDYVSPGGHRCKVIPAYPPSFINAVWKERNATVFDYKKAWNLARSDEPIVEPKYNFLIEPSFPETMKVISDLQTKVEAGPTRLSVDIETRGGHIACTGIAWSEVDAICIPQMRATIDPLKVHYWHEAEEAFITYRLYKLLTHPNAEVIGQNFLYDAQYFYRHFHFIPNLKRDTMIAAHSMFSNRAKGLDVLSSFHCKYHKYWKDESKNWDPKLGEKQLWIYNCIDCIRTFEIDEDQQKAINNWTSWPELRKVHDFQQSLFYPVLSTMIRGLRVNNESKAQLSNELAAAIKQREDWITSVLGHSLNIKSPVQMKDLFYRVFAQKPILNRKTHQPTCDDAALERIATREPLLKPLCVTIRDLRSLGVFRSTFLEAPVDIDERMRCSFNITGTETYRFSSSENAFGSGMNLQNIPVGDEESGLPNVRKLFVTDQEPEPMEYFDIDLDSADLRIVVWDADCALMKKWFAEGKKPYVEVAKEYYQDPTITKHHDAYKAFKVICHATNYLGQGSAILERMPKSAKLGNNLSVDSIAKIQAWYFKMFPEIQEWQQRTIREVSGRGYIQNVFGYREYIFDRIEGTIFNQAVAWKPQSTVACLINRGYANIHNNEPDIQILLQVHDSLAGQYPIRIRDYAQQKIIKHCSVPLPFDEPLIIPVGIKTSPKSWGDCE